MTRAKVCGIMSELDLESAVSGGADAIGFIVEIVGSRHRISAKAAGDLIAKVPLFVKSVAVIAPNSVDEAVKLANKTGADLLQIHGTLGVKDIIALKARVPQKIIAAAPAGPDNIHNIRNLSTAADAVLFDTFKDGQLGGTGATHDWNVSASTAKDLKVPIILAGGLNPSNVAEAIKIVRPYAVDVSSGVETEGRKDPEKVAAFVKAVRSCP